MNNPQFLTLFTIVFILLGAYNIYIGLKRRREAQKRGQTIAWYKQTNLLIGLEYLLLSFVFLMSININNHTLPSSLKSIVVPFYLIVLLGSAVLAAVVIRQSILNTRRTAQKTPAQPERNGSVTNKLDSTYESDSKQQTQKVQHRRERRQKAAAARRRRSGKA